MLSRVANSIYWMSRYVERAENLARFIDVTLNLMLDQSRFAVAQWEPLVYTTGDHEYFSQHYGVASQENVIRFITFDREYDNSIISVLHLARENARSSREVISSDMWEQLNEFYHMVQGAASDDRPLDSPSEFFRQVKQSSHLFCGVTDATMSHGEGWNFVNIGRFLERADKTSRIMDVKYFTLMEHTEDMNTSIDDLQWSAVLRSVSALEMFRKRYHGITVQRVVEFLALGDDFPRAIQYCLEAAEESLHEITGTPLGSIKNTVERQLGRLRTELLYSSADEIVNDGLHQFIDKFQSQLNDIGQAIHDEFFMLRSVEAPPSQFQYQG